VDISKWNSPDNPPKVGGVVLVVDLEQNPDDVFLCVYDGDVYMVKPIKPSNGWFEKDEIDGWVYALEEDKE